MSPRNIAAEARRRELDLIGVCDHNSAENAGAVAEAARRLGIRALPGMEVTSREEVHVLALFDEIDSALSLQDRVYAALDGFNDTEVFGLQVLADPEDEVLGFNDRFLAGTTALSLGEVVDAVHGLGGLAVAAHADRPGFGIIGQLGFIPERLPLDAVEISPQGRIQEIRRACGPDLPVISSSDAHSLEEIGRKTTSFRLDAASAEEIGWALKSLYDRCILSLEPAT